MATIFNRISDVLVFVAIYLIITGLVGVLGGFSHLSEYLGFPRVGIGSALLSFGMLMRYVVNGKIYLFRKT